MKCEVCNEEEVFIRSYFGHLHLCKECSKVYNELARSFKATVDKVRSDFVLGLKDAITKYRLEGGTSLPNG